ncbi:hypothetical protein [Cryobacterium sp. Y11]|uniref:hypothetical protein n=1 Tax=Cryobacterium sp. Y11 TaxID=2045016 RepID=UPI000CE3B746|nr:hypothetical protein [Cryobacterium sp. Y11]
MSPLTHSVGRSRFGALAIALAVLLSGCAGLPGFPAATDTPVAQLAAEVDCQAPNLNHEIVVQDGVPTQTDLTAEHPAAPDPGRVPADFEPVAAYRCTFFGSLDDAQGRWSAVTVENLQGDFGLLLAALAEPNDQAGPNQVCTADMELVPTLWLENADGDALRAAWPRTACGKTKPAAHAALDNLDLTDTTLLPLVLQVTREALDANCAMTAGAPEQSLLFGATGLQTYRNPTEIGEGVQLTPASPAETPSFAGVDGASVCVYTVAPARDPDLSELNSIDGLDGDALGAVMNLQFGTFASASILEADAAALLAAAASASQAPECTADLTRFAVLWPERGDTRLDTSTQIELDGCQRLFLPGSHALVPEPALLAALQ